MSGFSNLVSAGLSFSKSLFSSDLKKDFKEFLQEQCKKNGYTSLYIPTTATGELTAAASLKKAQKISKWEGLNDQKWIGLMIYQHRTHAECPFKHEFKCIGLKVVAKRKIGEGKEYSNSAFKWLTTTANIVLNTLLVDVLKFIIPAVLNTTVNLLLLLLL